MSERFQRTSEQTDERVAQYCSLYFWLFWTIVPLCCQMMETLEEIWGLHNETEEAVTSTGAGKTVSVRKIPASYLLLFKISQPQQRTGGGMRLSKKGDATSSSSSSSLSSSLSAPKVINPDEAIAVAPLRESENNSNNNNSNNNNGAEMETVGIDSAMEEERVPFSPSLEVNPNAGNRDLYSFGFSLETPTSMKAVAGEAETATSRAKAAVEKAREMSFIEGDGDGPIADEEETSNIEDTVEMAHYGTKPGHFKDIKFHFPTSEGLSEVSERASE